MIDDEGIPLPPEPTEPDVPEPAPILDPTGAAHRPPSVGEILRGMPWAITAMSAAEAAEAERVHAAARAAGRVERDADGRRAFRRLRDEFDPQGRHVPCDRCRARSGFRCEHPLRGVIAGFAHPSRVVAEARAFGVEPPFAP